MLYYFQKLESLFNEKKKFKQRFKNFCSFPLDNEKIIDRSCLKKILTTLTFHIILHKKILEFFGAEKVSGGSLTDLTEFTMFKILGYLLHFF